MARFGDNPLKNPLAGNEVIPATDPATTDDIGTTAAIITQFAQQNMTLASGSSNGLISGPMAAKLAGLYDNSVIDAKVQALSEVALPIFVATPSDGSQNIYTHILDPNWTFALMVGVCSAGSTNATITINGVPITGLSSVPVTPAGTTAIATAANELIGGSAVGFTLAGTTGDCRNVSLSLKAITAVP